MPTNPVIVQRQVKCLPYFKRATPTPVVPHTSLSRPTPPTWTVPALAHAYSWPGGLKGGGVIAIVELGGGWVAGDMVTYFKSIGQLPPQITDISVDGTTNSKQSPRNDADVEVALDIQVAGAAYYAATGHPATIRVYWAQDIAPAVVRAMEDGCDVCSISWGADEAEWGNNALEEMEGAVRIAAAKGMVVFAAAGDNDSSDGGPSSANVDAPGSCPHAISCGGTNKQVVTPFTETVWNDNPGRTNGEGTGGGYSMVFPVQSWQVGAPKAPARVPGDKNPGTGRMVPDVCANADPETGYVITVYGKNEVVGGTSAVAPLYAGLFAAFGTKLGWVTPKLWSAPASFNDITLGNNGDYSAAKGPDPCSGLGSPVGNKLAGLFGV